MNKNISFLILLFLASNIYSQVSVLTHHNDNFRTGANINETILDITNVDTSHFGKLCERPVDDEVYAQPLVVSNVGISGQGIRNVLYIATVNNTIYAYDADERMITNPYWTVNLTPAGSRVPRALDYSMLGACGGDYRDFGGNIGIVGTPVIDTSSHTIYFVSKNIVTLTGEYQHWLHALDIRDGSQKPNSPVLIEATLPGTGEGSVNGYISFDAKYHNQRAALLLDNNTVYITWASYCVNPPYHGWVIGYDAQSLQRNCAWMDTPNGRLGGIWMGGGGISADGNGNIYLSTGNGEGMPDSTNLNLSIIKLTRQDSSLKVASFFAPHNYDYLNFWDSDIGTCAVMLIPGTDMAVTAGKEGFMYVLDRDSMGGIDTVDHVRQKIDVGGTECHGGSCFWHSDVADYVYIWPCAERTLLRYNVDYTTQTLDTSTLMQSTMTNDFRPGGIISLSANGSQPGTGILWANTPIDASEIGVPNRRGILRAFDASDITHELWNSQMNTNRDSIKNYPKFVPPTIANGRVYMATFSGKVIMYGIFDPDGVEENSGAFTAQVYPNPTQGKLTLLMKQRSAGARVIISNSIGEMVYQLDDVNNDLTEIDITTLPPGVYFLTLQSPKLVWTTKVMKTK